MWVHSQNTSGASKANRTCINHTSSIFLEDTRSKAMFRVFFLTSRSGADNTLKMSITRSYVIANVFDLE